MPFRRRSISPLWPRRDYGDVRVRDPQLFGVEDRLWQALNIGQELEERVRGLQDPMRVAR